MHCGALVCTVVLITIRKSMAGDHCDVAVLLSWLFVPSVPLALFPSIYLSESKALHMVETQE